MANTSAAPAPKPRALRRRLREPRGDRGSTSPHTFAHVGNVSECQRMSGASVHGIWRCRARTLIRWMTGLALNELVTFDAQ